MKGLYNSALKNGTVQITGVKPTLRFESASGIGMKHNLLDPLPQEFFSCDVWYCEPPFPAGIKVFNERAKESVGYKDFCLAFARVFEQARVPLYAITNKRLRGYLRSSDAEVKVKLNGNWETLSIWGGPVPEDGLTNLEVCYWLGQQFDRVGDFTSGYGVPVMEFLKARPGNTFVASDYDAHCITVLRGLVQKHENLS